MKPPSFPFYVNNWLGSARIAAMSPAQEGAYVRLLCFAWNDETCSLPGDDSALAMLSRLGPDWRDLGPAVRACFVERDGRLYSERLVACRQEADEYRDTQVQKARRRWAGHDAGAHAPAKPPQCRGNAAAYPAAYPAAMPNTMPRQCSESESDSESEIESEKGRGEGGPADRPARHQHEKYGSTAPILGTTAPAGGATKPEPTREPTMNHPSAAAEPPPKNQPPQKRWTYDHEAGEIRGVIPADIEKLKATFPYIDAQAVILDCEAYLGSDKCKKEYTNVWAFVLNACKREQRHRWADTHEMDIRLEQQSRENVQTVIQQQRETAEREAREAKERACGRQN